MNKYSKEQSYIIGLWVLAKRREGNNFPAPPDGVAPEYLSNIVNKVGEYHSPSSILLHTHGYDRLFFNRDINKTITSTQYDVASEMVKEGIIEEINGNKGIA